MKRILFFIIGASLLVLSGCNGASYYSEVSDGSRTSLHARLEAIGNEEPRPDGFTICYAYGCSMDSIVSLDDEEWSSVIEAFLPVPIDGAEEREALRISIARLEQIIGEKTGTGEDVHGTFAAPFSAGQMDCEDEMLNTATYLRLLEDEGFLQYHHIAGQAHRGAFINGWPHMATRIQDNADNQQYVVDSWFHDNGVLPEVVPVDIWQSGWKPEEM